MRPIGVLGGTCWEETANYVRYLDEAVRTCLGEEHSVRCLVLTTDAAGSLPPDGAKCAAERLAGDAVRLCATGAALVVFASVPVHACFDEVEAAVGVPVPHVADAAARAARDRGMGTVALLGTAETMVEAFFRDRLARHGLEVLVPEPVDREVVDALAQPRRRRERAPEEEQRQQIRAVIARLADAGAHAVVVAAAELEPLVPAVGGALPVLPARALHARAAVALAIEDEDQH